MEPLDSTARRYCQISVPTDPETKCRPRLLDPLPPLTATNTINRVEIGSEGGAEYRVTFEDTINPGDVSLLTTHLEGLTGTGAALVAREVSP